jgi:hypothetical protein
MSIWVADGKMALPQQVCEGSGEGCLSMKMLILVILALAFSARGICLRKNLHQTL